MPIDPSIALQVRPPVDPLQSYGKALAIKGEMQQQQMGNLALQEHQRTLARNVALDKAYGDALGSDGSIDTGKLTNALATGGHGSAIPGVLKGVNEFNKSTGELSKLNAEVADKQADYGGTIGATLRDANYDPRLFLTKANAALKAKALDSRLVQPYLDHVSQLMQDDPTGESARAAVQQISAHLISGSPAQQKLINEKANSDARALSAKTGATRLAEELPGIRAGAQEKQQTLATKERQDAAALLATATDAEDYKRKWGELKGRTAVQFPSPGQFDPEKTPALVRQMGLTAEQQQTAAHNLSSESTAKLNLAVNQGRLAQTQLVNGLKYGPGSQEYWVKQLQENPDSIKEMPAELRTTVGQKFREATGLPLPTQLTGNAVNEERAAHNALDGISFIKKALDNPEIRKQIGPIMGRLGNAEQSIGTAVGLSPEAAQLAQELRTRMRYFVFQEGKAVLGGRLPQQLMKAMEESSASVKMDPSMLHGALAGAEGNAQSILDNADKQRFGGRMRSRQMRGEAQALPKGDGAVIDKATAMKFYEAAGRDPAKANKLAMENGWKTE